MHHLRPHLPSDRLQTLITGIDLSSDAIGSVLFADLAGFTPLTEQLLHHFGARRGAEELTQILDAVYDSLITTVHAYGGSVISFSGDAITCWFPCDDARHAIAGGLAMQQAMAPFADYPLAPDSPISLTLKVTIAAGAVQRFVVGDPAIQRIDILAGAPLARLAVLDSLARPGEVLVDARLARALADELTIAAWRADGGDAQGAVITGLRSAMAWDPHLPSMPADVSAGLEQWIAPTVLARLEDPHTAFLTELRPVVALFLRFGSHGTPLELDGYIRWVQHVLLRYEATLLQVSVGDKGSYLYAAFGAPIAHEDDAIRAVRAARDLRDSPHAVQTLGVGLATGIARTGVYGSATRCTYGVLGDAVNLAARLMQYAEPGQILASDRIWFATSAQFSWDRLTPLTVKGKQTPLHVARLCGSVALPTQSSSILLVGRTAELDAMQARLELVRQGLGQVLVITGDAGIGKSRLSHEARGRLGDTSVVLVGGTQSYATSSPYRCWIPIWQAIFGVAPAAPLTANLRRVTATLERLAPHFLPQVPLLASMLALPIPDTDLTRALEPTVRKERLEALLAASLRAYTGDLAATGRSLLLILEDLHWIDALSADLLRSLAPLIADRPVAMIVTSRPTAATARLRATLDALTHASTIALADLSPDAVSALLRARLPMGADARLLASVQARAHGNPFYVEELISYLRASDAPIDERYGWEGRELPTGLHRLVLSRIDQLDARQQRVLKTASVLGSSFPRSWLWEMYPALGSADHIQADLDALERSDLLVPTVEPDVCRFKHAITREVTYESLGRRTRAALHEQCATALEQRQPDAEAPLDLLAYHYEQSCNDAKAVVYLARNAARAKRLFANQDAIDQYRRAIQRASQLPEPPLPRATLERGLGEVYAQMATFGLALASYDHALAALPAGDILGRAEVALLQADVLVRATRFDEAVALIVDTEMAVRSTVPKGIPLPSVARVLLARLAELRSHKHQRQSELQHALQWAKHGLKSIAQLPASDDQVMETRTRLYQAASTAAMALDDFPQARRLLLNAIRLGNRYPNPAMNAELHLQHALLLLGTSTMTATIRQFRAVVAQLELTGTRDRLAYALLPGGLALASAGIYREAQEWLTRGIELGKAIGSAFLVAAGLPVLCWVNTRIGNWNAVLEDCGEGTLLAQRYALRERVLHFLFHEAEIRMYRGEFARSAQLFNEHRAYSEHHHLDRTNESSHGLARTACLAGHLTESIATMRAVPIDLEHIAHIYHALDILGVTELWVLLTAQGAVLPHDPAVLAGGVARSRALIQKRGFRCYVPYAWRIHAMMEWHANRLPSAVQAIERGLAAARRSGEVPEHARCLFWRAKIAIGRNAPETVMRDLKKAASLFASLDAHPEHVRTLALMKSPHDRSIVL